MFPLAKRETEKKSFFSTCQIVYTVLDDLALYFSLHLILLEDL